MEIKDKKSLEFILERIPRYDKPKRELEQYETPSSIASHILWTAYMKNDIRNKRILEPGCGIARFSIGALLLGADNVVCIDMDREILEFSEKLVSELFHELKSRIVFVYGDFTRLEIQGVDTIIMNPPFGVVKKNRGIDILFLKKALTLAKTVYTLHKYSLGLENMIFEIASIYGFKITYREVLDFPIPMMFITHRRKIYRVKTVFYVLEKVG